MTISNFTKKATLLLIGATIAATSLISPSSAAGMKRNDPNRPVAAIAADLGVTTEEFVTCFHDVNPAPKGTTPTREREQANKAILLPCLQDANASITNDSLDAVMDKYRPEGRVAKR